MNANITVNAAGQVTTAANGSATPPITCVPVRSIKARAARQRQVEAAGREELEPQRYRPRSNDRSIRALVSYFRSSTQNFIISNCDTTRICRYLRSAAIFSFNASSPTAPTTTSSPTT